MTYLYVVNSCLTLSFRACSEALLDVMKKVLLLTNCCPFLNASLGQRSLEHNTSAENDL